MVLFFHLLTLRKSVTSNPSVVEKLGEDFPFLELLKNHKLKKYMRKFGNQTNTQVVKQAYDALNQYFHSLFTHITQFKCLKDSKNYWQHKLFNTDGIIPHLFQYLDLKSVIKCSFVHSIWLYHSFNPNSIYYFETRGDHDYLMSMNKSWEHRLSRIQRLKIEFYSYKMSKKKGLEKLISSSKHLKRVEVFANTTVCLLVILESLHNNGIDVNLQQFTCFLDPLAKTEKISDHQLDSKLQLQLTNCHTVKLKNSVVKTFDIKLSDRCKYLSISGYVDNMHNFLSHDSDCSGIEMLKIDNIRFIRNINNDNSYDNYNGDNKDNDKNNDDNASESSKKMNIFAHKIKFNKIQNLLVDDLTTDTLLLWQHLSIKNINCNIDPVVTLILQIGEERVLYSYVYLKKLIQMIECNQIVPVQRLIINVIAKDTKEIISLGELNVLLRKSILEQYIKTIELNLCSPHHIIPQAFLNDKINCKDVTFLNTFFIQPHDIFSKIDTSEQLKQNGIECGVPDKCLMGWKRLDIVNGNPHQLQTNFNIDDCIGSVSALRFNEKTKKLFVQYSSMRCLFDATDSGQWFQLPNENFYPCSKKNNYQIQSKNLIHKIYENFENVKRISITTDKTDCNCKTWVIDMLKSFIQLKCLGLDLTVHELELKNDDNDQGLDLIKNIFKHTRTLIDENVAININIRYSTFSFAQCDKLFLQILIGNNRRSRNNGKSVTLDHINCCKTGMTLFHARCKCVDPSLS